MVGVFDVRKKPFSIKSLESALQIFAISNKSGVGWIPIGANGAEAYPPGFNMGAVVFSGCDDY